MKVDLDNLVLSKGSMTDNIYAGVLNKAGTMFLQKTDVSNYFIDCVIKRWEGQKEIISAGEQKWEISVNKLNKTPLPAFRRNRLPYTCGFVVYCLLNI